jgi:hypothetical protein
VRKEREGEICPLLSYTSLLLHLLLRPLPFAAPSTSPQRHQPSFSLSPLFNIYNL